MSIFPLTITSLTYPPDEYPASDNLKSPLIIALLNGDACDTAQVVALVSKFSALLQNVSKAPIP